MTKFRRYRMQILSVPIALLLIFAAVHMNGIADGFAPDSSGIAYPDVSTPYTDSDPPPDTDPPTGEPFLSGNDPAPAEGETAVTAPEETGEFIIADEPTALFSGEELLYDPQPQSDMEVLAQIGDYLHDPSFRQPRWKEPLPYGWTPCQLSLGQFTDPETGLVYWTVGVWE